MLGFLLAAVAGLAGAGAAPPAAAPPVVAVPRAPGAADTVVVSGRRNRGRTLGSYPSNEACDAALAGVRRTHPRAVCLSGTMLPRPPRFGLLVQIEHNVIVGLQPFSSMAECKAALRQLPRAPGRRRMCVDRLH